MADLKALVAEIKALKAQLASLEDEEHTLRTKLSSTNVDVDEVDRLATLFGDVGRALSEVLLTSPTL
jgi:hypothetical protein